MYKFEKDQIVIVIPTGNASRRGKKEKFEARVETVGKKYFTLKSDTSDHYLGRFKFNLENLKQVGQYSPDYEVFISVEDYNKKTGRPIILDKVQRSLYGMDYDNLVKIQEFINTLS